MALVVTESEKGYQLMLTVFSKSDVLRTKVPFNTSEVIVLYIAVAFEGQWVTTPPKIFSIP